MASFAGDYESFLAGEMSGNNWQPEGRRTLIDQRREGPEGEQFLGLAFPSSASSTCCSDAAIGRALGIVLDTSRNGLFGFDSAFSGAGGAQFAVRVRSIAQRVHLDPGLLATNLLAEVQRRAVWMSGA